MLRISRINQGHQKRRITVNFHSPSSRNALVSMTGHCGASLSKSANISTAEIRLVLWRVITSPPFRSGTRTDSPGLMAEISDGLRDSWRLVIVFMLTILSDNASASSGIQSGPVMPAPMTATGFIQRGKIKPRFRNVENTCAFMHKTHRKLLDSLQMNSHLVWTGFASVF